MKDPVSPPLFVTLLLSAYQSSLFFVLCLVLDYISSCALLINFFDQLKSCMSQIEWPHQFLQTILALLVTIVAFNRTQQPFVSISSGQY